MNVEGQVSEIYSNLLLKKKRLILGPISHKTTHHSLHVAMRVVSGVQGVSENLNCRFYLYYYSMEEQATEGSVATF